MKKIIVLFSMLFFLPLTLTACGKKGADLNSGECKGIVSFPNIPKEFTLLGDDFMENFSIYLELYDWDDPEEKEYHITLNQSNNFCQEVSLPPGDYHIAGPDVTGTYNIKLQLENSTKDTGYVLNFSPGQVAVLTFYAANLEEFIQNWIEMHPLAEILLADKYSGVIQINRKIISIRDILSELEIDENALNEMVWANREAVLTDSGKNVTVTVKNTSDENRPCSECTVVSITTNGWSKVLFPSAVFPGMKTEDICHKENGLYGQPTSFGGTLLFGWGLATSTAVYSDPVSKNRITLHLNADGHTVREILYELDVVEEE